MFLDQRAYHDLLAHVFNLGLHFFILGQALFFRFLVQDFHIDQLFLDLRAYIRRIRLIACRRLFHDRFEA